MSEKNTMGLIQLALGKLPHVKTFRNNTGTGWVGTKCQSKPGTVVLKDARPLHAGLCEGSSDLIGWTEVTITPDMVGRKLAVFTALEVKTETGRVSEKQLNFIEVVAQAGGIAGIVRTPEGARTIIESKRM